MPPKVFATRIENTHGGGVPDVHAVWDGFAFWMELKVCNSNSVRLSPHQIAWNMAYAARGGVSYFLVKRAADHRIFLFDGFQGPALALSGLSGAEGLEFKTVKELWEHLSTLRPAP
jgi:hypothetical protein